MNLSNASDHNLVCQTSFFFLKDISHLNINSHTTVSQTEFTTDPVCETVLWSPASWYKMS